MAGNSNIHSTAPDAYIVAFPYRKEVSKVGEKFSEEDLRTTPTVIDVDILSIQTNKGKGGAGNFRITLASRINYKAMLHHGCWIAIYLDDEHFSPADKKESNGKNHGLKMIGVINSLRVNEGLGHDGHKSIRYDISGEDFHSLLTSKIYINSLFRIPAKDGSAAVNSLYYMFGDEFDTFKEKEGPSKIVDRLLNATLAKDVGPRSSPSIKGKKTKEPILGGTMGIPPELAKKLGAEKSAKNNFNNAIKRIIQPDLWGAIIMQPSVPESFTIWSLIKAYSNPVANEVYTDLVYDNGKLVPAFVCRAIPFSTKAGSIVSTKDKGGHGTKTITTEDKSIQLYVSKNIEEHEIISLNYGKSTSELFNFFWIASATARHKEIMADSLVNIIADGDLINIADPTSIARHGLRTYITQCDYIVAPQEAAEINKIVRDLWSSAHLFDNGQVTIVGAHDHIAVGTNIYFKERGWIAHVEGVSHTYSAHGEGHKEYLTTITFVRLQTKDGNPIDLVEKEGKATDRGATHSHGGEK